MSMFDLKGNTSSSNIWNYSDNTRQDYLECIEGTVVEISNPQARDFNTKKPAFWDDGNPKRNLCVCLRGRSGQELSWIFAPKSKAAEACLVALDPQGTRDQVSIEELLGKFVRIQTQAGAYNGRNPRPWWVTILGDGEANMVRGLKDLTTQPANAMPGMPAPQPAPVQQQTPPPMPQQQVPTQTPMQQAQQQAAAAMGFQAPPQVNAAPVNAYENDPTGGYYSEDIPW